MQGTKLTLVRQLTQLNTKNPQHMALEIQVLAGYGLEGYAYGV
jgi:hypothetical protein